MRNAKMEIAQAKIIDTTLKEGGFRVNHLILQEQAENIIRELGEAGIQYIEASHGKGIGGKEIGYPSLLNDEEILSIARKAAPQAKLVVYISTFPFSLEALPQVIDQFDIGRVGVNVHQPELAVEAIKQLKEKNKIAIAHILRCHARPPAETAEAAKALRDQGSDVIYLSDSFGSFSPDDVKTYFEAIRGAVNLPLGFQGRNNTGMAIINSMTALELGVEWFDASILGMGQGAGVSNLEELVMLLQKRDLAKDINLQELCINGKFYVWPALRSLPYSREIDLLLARHRLDYAPQQFIEIIAEILNIDLETLIKNLKNIRKDLVQLREPDFRKYLEGEKIDLDILLDYLKTGTIPVFAET